MACMCPRRCFGYCTGTYCTTSLVVRIEWSLGKSYNARGDPRACVGLSATIENNIFDLMDHSQTCMAASSEVVQHLYHSYRTVRTCSSVQSWYNASNCTSYGRVVVSCVVRSKLCSLARWTDALRAYLFRPSADTRWPSFVRRIRFLAAKNNSIGQAEKGP